MYKIHIEKEFATSLPFTKIYINNETVAKTSSKPDNSIDSDEYGKDLYMKGLLLKTNTVKTPTKDSVYSLIWKQNYIYILIFGIILLKLVVMAIGEADYTMSVIITMMAIVAPIIILFWNDLLILGRKIEIKELGEKNNEETELGEKSNEETQMKWTSNISSLNKFGYFIVGAFILMEIMLVWEFIMWPPDLPQKGSLFVLIPMLAYLIYGYLPYIHFRRKIGIDKEYGIILSLISYEDYKYQKAYKISEIKDYSIIRIAQAEDVWKKDPTLQIPTDSGARIFYFILYIEFNNGEILNLAYGNKRKMKKKQKQIKEYIEGSENEKPKKQIK